MNNNEDLKEVYKNCKIKQDFSSRTNKYYSVVEYKVLWGGSVEIVKRKIDKQIDKNISSLDCANLDLKVLQGRLIKE